MSERNVLAACLNSREAMDTVLRFSTPDEFGEQARIVLGHLEEYYETDPGAQFADADIVERSIARTMSTPKHVETFSRILKAISEMDVSAPNVVRDLLEVKRKNAGDQLATVLTGGAEQDKVSRLLEQYQELSQAASLADTQSSSEVLQDVDLEEMFEDTYADGQRIRILPRQLNERLAGGLLRGHHMLVFARPEMGKTAVMINMTAGFLNQGYTVLYCGNEDPTPDMMARFVSRLTNTPTVEVQKDVGAHMEAAREKGYSNLVFAKLTPGSLREVEALASKYQPDVIILDQLRNLKATEESRVNALEHLAQGARTLGQRHDALVISVTQAGDSASDKSVLDLNDVDYSKTGIPAAVDVMLGIGATDDDKRHNRLMFSLCKNKPGNNHDFFQVKIVPHLSKIRGID
ncbi:MAG: DnaB-like helicase C-terminal domain-containing protein [Myxococcota bacterium]|nr:DnaB-like helicase C-terminal domain-containing protein [Myxococcota bacterium]